MSTFEKLTGFRKKLGIKQNKMAGYLGVTKSTLCKYEKGDRKISSEMQDLYCEKLGIDIILTLK